MPPPWAVTDASGAPLLRLCVATADGAAAPLADRGVPRCRELLCTTPAHGATALEVRVLLGTRPVASGCRLVGVLHVPVCAAPRGLAQVHVSADVSADALLLSARDVQTGLAATLRVGPEDMADDAEAPVAGAPTAGGGVLPLPWRFETAYTDEAHPGFCCAGGRFIRVPPPAPHAAASRVAADGEVVPSVTADTVWPGAYLLASYCSQPEVARTLAGARVIELGAGSGVPGLAAWVAGARTVALTDLPENLDRLRAVVAANGASAGVEVQPVDWCAPPARAEAWDVLLAADCVFWPALFAPLLQTLRALAHPDGAAARRAPPRVLLSVTRRLDRAERFAAAARAAGWAIEEVSACEARLPHTSVWSLTLTAARGPDEPSVSLAPAPVAAVDEASDDGRAPRAG